MNFMFEWQEQYLTSERSTNILIGDPVKHKWNQIIFNQIKSNQMLVFVKRGKLEYQEKNLSEQSRERWFLVILK